MKQQLKKFDNFIITAIRLLMYGLLFVWFILLFGLESPALWTLSRTAGVTMLTFGIVGLFMIRIYGGFDIGKRKSKPIIFSLVFAALFTDLIAYVQLSIMNTNVWTNYQFSFASVSLLVSTFILQIITIIIATYAGNAIFFSLNEPEISYVITGCKEEAGALLHAIGRFKKQYRVAKIIELKERDNVDLKSLKKAQTLFLHNLSEQQRSLILDYCFSHQISVLFNPELADIVEITSKHLVLDDVSLIETTPAAFTLEQRFVKRMIDLVISFIGLIVTSPISLVAAFAIKIGDRGPVLFAQERLTRGGKRFQIYKFRTMCVDADTTLLSEEDQRVTKVGHFLRRYRIDELPQLFNVLKGEMSIVGPRAMMTEVVQDSMEQLPEFKYRMRVKSGLTGYAQIAGRYNTSAKDKLILDLLYIEEYSVFRDIQLMFQTLFVLFRPDSTAGYQLGKVEDNQNEKE